MKIFISTVLSFFIFSGIVFAQVTVEHAAIDKLALHVTNTTSPDFPGVLESNSGLQSFNATHRSKLPQNPENSFEIMYLANEGILITSNEKQILIDGLFRSGGPNYVNLPEEEQEKLETASVPYDSIDIILTTHRHGDHFYAQSVGRYLVHNENAYFIAPWQTVQELSSQFASYSAIEDRVEGIILALYQDTTVTRKGVEIEIFRLEHWYPDPQLEHVCYLINIDGKKILHLADSYPTVDNFDVFDLQEKDIDVAIIPYWLLINSDLKTLIDTHIRPKQIIAAHIPAADFISVFPDITSISATIKNIHPEALLFTEMLFSTTFNSTMKPLFANFQAETRTGHAPLTVQFTDLSTQYLTITSWAWDFDMDGTIDSDAQNPAWTYDTPGIYTVSLQVSNDTLYHTKICEKYIHVFDGESALLFNGRDSYVSCPASPSLNSIEKLSVEAWIKPSGWGENPALGAGRIIDKFRIALFLIDTSPIFNNHSLALQLSHIDGNLSISMTEENSISLGEWQHIAVTYDGTNNQLKMFINGIEKTLSHTQTPSGTIADNNSYDLIIGSNKGAGLTFDGLIDEIRIWNIVRTAEEIQANKDKHFMRTTPGLVGCYGMNEGFGEVVGDISGNGNDGTVINALWRQGLSLTPTLIKKTEDNNPITDFRLCQNYPNPFNAETKINFTLTEVTQVSIKIYTITGKLVRTLIDCNREAGSHSVIWNGKDDRNKKVSSGIYLYKMIAGAFSKTNKMILLK